MAQFPSTTSASDVWNVTDIYRAVAGGNWPSVLVADPYFEYVSMLLPGNGTNGAQNNTFLDSGPNTYTITRSGNTTQGSFSPYGSGWSMYGVSSSGITANFWPSGALVGTGGTFSTEFFFLGQSISTGWMLGMSADNSPSGFQKMGPGVAFSGTGNLTVYLINTGGTIGYQSSATAYLSGQWNHLAIVRTGGTLAWWLNGTRIDSVSNSTNIDAYRGVLGSVYVDNPTRDSMTNCYISNFRASNSVAYYNPSSSTITVPTTPFTAASGTTFITCQSNRFIDTSGSNTTISVAGEPRIQRFSPFSPTSSYSTSAIGGSGYFDGNGDNLVTSGAGSFNPRSTFTVEFWTYPITNTTVTWINSNTNDNFYIETFSGTLYVGDGSINTISTTPPALYSWTHVLLSFDGTTYRLFYNGVSQATSTTLLASTTLTAFRVGQKNDTSRPFSGFISDMRVLVGTALYTSAFTPPTAPLAAISNTILLLSYTNAGIIDNAMMNNLETVGNVQISTSVSKFGGGSIAFDGAGDILKITPDVNVNMNFDTGPFTFECWVYRSSASGQIFIADFGVTSVNGWALYDEGATGNMQVRIADVDRIAVSPIPATTWTHLAVVRVGTTITLYVNGTSAGSYASAGTNFIYAGTKYIGSQSGSSSYMNGYMDDIRITKGLARYTANFTAPTEAFPTF